MVSKKLGAPLARIHDSSIISMYREIVHMLMHRAKKFSSRNVGLVEAAARLPGTAPHVAGRHALVGHSCTGTTERPIANLCQETARNGWGQQEDWAVYGIDT